MALKLMKDSVFNVDFELIAKSTLKASAVTPGVAKFRFMHSKRVAKIAKELAKGIEGIDTDKIYIAAIFHDTYKYLNEDHGLYAGKILEDIIYNIEKKNLTEWEPYIDAVKMHSVKPKDDDNVIRKILYESDKLDKLSKEYIVGIVRDIQQYDSQIEAYEHSCKKIEKIDYITSPNYNKVKQRMMLTIKNIYKR